MEISFAMLSKQALKQANVMYRPVASTAIKTWQSEKDSNFQWGSLHSSSSKQIHRSKLASPGAEKPVPALQSTRCLLHSSRKTPARRLGYQGVRKGFLNDHIKTHIQLILSFIWDYCFLIHENNYIFKI